MHRGSLEVLREVLRRVGPRGVPELVDRALQADDDGVPLWKVSSCTPVKKSDFTSDGMASTEAAPNRRSHEEQVVEIIDEKDLGMTMERSRVTKTAMRGA